MGVKHAKTSAKGDGADATQVQPSDWNADHVGDYVSGASGSGHIVIPGLAGSPDVVPASPSSYDDEFESLSGWTTLGSLNTSNVTDFPSHWHVKKATIGLQIHGIYKAAPSTPFTVTAKFSDIMYAGNYNEYGLALGDSTPTAWWSMSLSVYPSPWSIQNDVWTNNTSRSGATNYSQYDQPRYLRLIVNSSTSVDVRVSMNGLIWDPVVNALNPGFASKVGIVVSANGVDAEAAVDWIRFT